MPGIPGVAVIVAELPAQVEGEFTATVGNGLTVTVTVLDDEQPFKVEVTVYVVVEAGETVIGFVDKAPGCHT